ncbi:molybdopterin-dependent oxidoreductase [Sinorhizobium medicae]|nr:molybdopterin-dependent oxidoreductase [Sinorhizobium medicae]
MTMRLGVFVGAFLCSAATAATAGTLLLDGEISQSVSITDEEFSKLPHVVLQLKDQNGQILNYSGVELSYLLSLAKVPIKQALKGQDINKYILASGADGFGAVFALPEFDSGRYIVADKMNGQALPVADGPLQIVSPDEVRRSRWIKQLIRINVRKALP